MAYGNTSVSALLNQARAALKKQQSLEEQVASYEYDLSPKDKAAYDKYSSFLSTRAKQVQSTDPAKALSLQRLITGAQRTFTSSELTRESINIAEGTGSKPQKLQKMISLYRQALENGDENLAQRIQLQADNLQVQIQNEAMAGAGRGGGGGSDATDKATKKGINSQLDKISSAQKELKTELAQGKINSNQYISQTAQLYDAKNKILQSTYTVDESGNIVQNQHSGLSYESVKDFYDKHQGLQQDNQFQQLMGSNPNVPFELRQAQIGNAFKAKYDPLSGEVKLDPNNIVGLRRMAEFGSTLAAPTVENNVDSTKYKEGFKKLGFDGGSNGTMTKTYTDALGNTREAPFYLDNPDNPTYAYTQDEKGVRYALTKDGKAIPLGDSAVADRQLKVLNERLANPNISPQEREAIQNDIQNLNTDYLPQGVTDEIAKQKQAEGDSAYYGLGRVGRKLGEAANDIPGVTSATNVLNKAKLGGLVSNIAKFTSGTFGMGGAPIVAGGQSFLNGVNDLTKKLGVLQEQKKQKDAADAARRAAEFAANQQAIAAANQQQQAYQAQVAAQNRQSVALPYKATPAGQAAANVIGSNTFNDKYLGTFGGNSLYNKFLR